MRNIALVLILLSLASCGGGKAPKPEHMSRIVGTFVAFGTSEKINKPDASGVKPCDNVLRILGGADYPGLVFIFRLDGDDWTCVKRFTESNADRPHEVRAYLFYHISEHPDQVILVGRARDLLQRFFEVANSNTRFSVVPVLEDRSTDEEFAAYAPAIEAIFGFPVDRNPLDHTRSSLGRFKEVHGHEYVDSETNTMSEDGFVYVPEQTRAWVKQFPNMTRVILWRPEWQDLCIDNNVPVKCKSIQDRVPHFDNVEEYRKLAKDISA